MCRVRIGRSTNENEAVLLCPQAHNNLLPGSLFSQLGLLYFKSNSCSSMTLTAAEIQGVDLSEPLVLFGILTLRIPSLMSRSPAYHCSHLNARASKRPPADLAIHYNTLHDAKEQADVTSYLPCIPSLACNWSID